MKLKTYNEFLSEAAQYTSNQNHSALALQGLHLRTQIHIFHWQTEVGDAHKALGEFYEEFIDELDNLVEVTMGKYGRVSVKGLPMAAPLTDLSDINPSDFVEKYVTMFETYRDDTFKNDPEIQNIIDEIVARIHKLKYLLTMS